MSAKLAHVPVLEGWHSLPKAAELLSVSRQRVYQMAEESAAGRSDDFPSLRQLPGDQRDDGRRVSDRPAAYVVSDADVQRLLAGKPAFAPPQEELAGAAAK